MLPAKKENPRKKNWWENPYNLVDLIYSHHYSIFSIIGNLKTLGMIHFKEMAGLTQKISYLFLVILRDVKTWKKEDFATVMMKYQDN